MVIKASTKFALTRASLAIYTLKYTGFRSLALCDATSSKCDDDDVFSALEGSRLHWPLVPSMGSRSARMSLAFWLRADGNWMSKATRRSPFREGSFGKGRPRP